MSDSVLPDKVSRLPENIKSEVFDFVDFLLYKYNNAKQPE